jgi:hypothetical protein
MKAPRLFLGARSSADLLEAEAGADDAGAPFTLRAVTAPVAPAGEAGVACFVYAHLVVRHTSALTLALTPVVDGTDYRGASMAFALRPTHLVERQRVALEAPYLRGGEEKFSVPPRGTAGWLVFECEDPGDLELLAVELEHRVVTGEAAQ